MSLPNPCSSPLIISALGEQLEATLAATNVTDPKLRPDGLIVVILICNVWFCCMVIHCENNGIRMHCKLY